MATQFASVPPSVLALPFLLARTRGQDLEWTVPVALASAISAERAVDDGRRNTRARLAWLLCELGFQLSRRSIDRDQMLPIPRSELAGALGTSLCRVKRTLALFVLSGVCESDGSRLRVTDWRRLASLGCYDPARLSLEPLEPELVADSETEEADNLVTRSGDQACFV